MFQSLQLIALITLDLQDKEKLIPKIITNLLNKKFYLWKWEKYERLDFCERPC